MSCFCPLQCSPALRLFEAQDVRSTWHHYNQWKQGALPPHQGAYSGHCGRSTKQPYQAARPLGCQAIVLPHAGPINPTYRQSCNFRVELAAYPPPTATYISGIHTVCAQLCTQNTLGIGGGNIRTGLYKGSTLYGLALSLIILSFLPQVNQNLLILRTHEDSFRARFHIHGRSPFL